MLNIFFCCCYSCLWLCRVRLAWTWFDLFTATVWPAPQTATSPRFWLVFLYSSLALVCSTRQFVHLTSTTTFFIAIFILLTLLLCYIYQRGNIKRHMIITQSLAGDNPHMTRPRTDTCDRIIHPHTTPQVFNNNNNQNNFGTCSATHIAQNFAYFSLLSLFVSLFCTPLSWFTQHIVSRCVMFISPNCVCLAVVTIWHRWSIRRTIIIAPHLYL